jgi:hypothetical protein
VSDKCPACGARLAAVRDAFCPECRQPLDEGDAEPEAVALARPVGRGSAVASSGPADRIAVLERRVAELEWRLQRSYLFSEHFLARVFTVVGYYFVAYAILVVPIVVIALFSSLLNR